MVPPPPPPPVRSSEKGNPGSNDEDHGLERADCVVKPNGRHVIRRFLTPKALFGKLRQGTIPGYVVEGVNIFSVKPDELPFQPSQHGEVWGYFFAARPASDVRAASGGRWVRYGPEKEYESRGKAVAFRRRFAFHADWRDGDGKVREPTRWLMKEYRFNREHDIFRGKPLGPDANLDCVIYKVFLKPVAPPPPPPPARSSEERPGSNNNPIIVDDEARPGSLRHAKHDRPKASKNLLGFRAFTKPVVPPPPHVCSSEKENPCSTCPGVDEDQAKEYRLNKDTAVFPRVQPNPKLVANMDRVVRPPPPLDLELRLGPPGSYSNNPSVGEEAGCPSEDQARWSARSRVETEMRARPQNRD